MAEEAEEEDGWVLMGCGSGGGLEELCCYIVEGLVECVCRDLERGFECDD